MLKPTTIITCLCIGQTSAQADSAGRVQLGSFLIDPTEVTIAAFTEYAERTGVITEAEKQGGGFEYGAGWERRPGWTFRTPFGKPAEPDEPAVHISWHEAKAYCEDQGGRLPTREEWSAAAYTEQRANPTDGFINGQTYPYPVGDTGDGMNNNRTSHVRVATTRRGVNGLYDMGANSWEWLADQQGDDALTAGGSWWYGPDKARMDGMQWKPTRFFALYVGVRCVYDADS